MASEKTTKLCGLIIFIVGIVLLITMIMAFLGGAKPWTGFFMGVIFTLLGWRMKKTGKIQ